MFKKFLSYLLAIHILRCSTKANERLRDLNILLNHNGWKKIDITLRPLTVVEYNPDGPELNCEELLRKDGTSNDIVTEENYKLKVQKVILLYSAIHAYTLNRLIDVFRGFWDLCEREGRKEVFLVFLNKQRNVFHHMLDALNFIAKFQIKGPLLAGENLKNHVTEALNHLIILSGRQKKSNECVTKELNSAYTSIKNFYKAHFRPVPVHITDDLNNLSPQTEKVNSVINNINLTLDQKLHFFMSKIIKDLHVTIDYHVFVLGFVFEVNDRLVKVTHPEDLGPPLPSDDENDD